MKRSEIVSLAVTLNITVFKEEYIYYHSKFNTSSLFFHETFSIQAIKKAWLKRRHKESRWKIKQLNQVKIKGSKLKRKEETLSSCHHQLQAICLLFTILSLKLKTSMNKEES